jgi:hypothetical protein
MRTQNNAERANPTRVQLALAAFSGPTLLQEMAE